MPAKSITIVGAGMAGLAAGIYGRLNGYNTRIFEMNSVPGGQCASWTRNGYTFDACIHHLFGCSDDSSIYSLWRDLGAMPRDLVATEECTAVLAPDGTLFRDYYDPERLEEHLLELAPTDARPIRDYVRGVRAAARADLMGELMMGSPGRVPGMLLRSLPTLKWFRPTMAALGERFSDPFLRRAFPLLVYSLPEAPAILHLARHGYAINGALKWPIAGSLDFARSIAHRYQELGGEIHYRRPVAEILTKNDRAVGIKCSDGTEHGADIVISAADGRKTIMELLKGRYTSPAIRKECSAPLDETNWAVHVFLGVNRDLSAEPCALVILLDKPETIAGLEAESLEMQMYGFDRTMAPEGKGVIKVELVSRHSYWRPLASDRAAYEEEKRKVARQVIGILEHHFPGLSGQVEVTDVPTLMTWERYMGGTHGFANMPTRKGSILGSLLGRGGHNTLPGLAGFYLAGVWTTMAGALFANALSGRKTIQTLCKEDGKSFASNESQ